MIGQLLYAIRHRRIFEQGFLNPEAMQWWSYSWGTQTDGSSCSASWFNDFQTSERGHDIIIVTKDDRSTDVW